MHQLTLGWDLANQHPVMLVDPVFDFPSGEVLSVDLSVSDFVPAVWASLAVGLFLYALWKVTGVKPRP